MKILYAVVECNTGLYQNAKERYVYHLAKEAKNRGHKVGVVCPQTSPLFTYLTQTTDTGIAVYPIQNSGKFDSFYKVLDLYKILNRSKPDIVHFNCPRFAAIGGLISKIAKIPKTIYTYHEWQPKNNQSWPILRKLFAQIISLLAIMSNNKIITLSFRERDKLKKIFRAKNKIIAIQNGIKQFHTQEKMPALISLLGAEKATNLIKYNKKILGSISSLYTNKGHLYTLQGLAQYKKFKGEDFNFHYIIIGNGPELNSLRNTVQNLGLNDDVTFVGFIREAKEFIKAFDIFISSNISDSDSYSTNSAFPQAILEAGLKKIPIITTNNGAVSELIKNLETGFLIPPGRPAEIKHTLNYIDEHVGIEKNCAENLYKKIENELMFSDQADKVFNLY